MDTKQHPLRKMQWTGLLAIRALCELLVTPWLMSYFFGHLGPSPGLLTVLENMANSREEGIDCCCRAVLWCWLTSGQPHDTKAAQSSSAEERLDGFHEKLGFPLLTSRGYSQCEASGERHSGKLMRSVWARAFWNQFLSRGWPILFQLTLVPLKCVTWMKS